MTDTTYERETSKAQQIVERLMEGEGRRRVDLPEGVSVLDLQHDVEAFMTDLRLAAALDRELPIVKVDSGPPIPISLSAQIGVPAMRWASAVLSIDFIDQALDSTSRRFANGTSAPPDVVRKFFSERAADFVQRRIDGPKRMAEAEGAVLKTLTLPPQGGQPPQPTPGCLFTVTTDNPGLRVFWSGAYYISGNYFGHPTSPATAVMQAGSYVFGVDGGAYGSAVQWDTLAICGIPGCTSVHLNY